MVKRKKERNTTRDKRDKNNMYTEEEKMRQREKNKELKAEKAKAAVEAKAAVVATRAALKEDKARGKAAH